MAETTIKLPIGRWAAIVAALTVLSPPAMGMGWAFYRMYYGAGLAEKHEHTDFPDVRAQLQELSRTQCFNERDTCNERAFKDLREGKITPEQLEEERLPACRRAYDACLDRAAQRTTQ